MTIAALPLSEIDATLSELLWIEGLVFSGVLLALGFGAWWIVRLGLRRSTRSASRRARSPRAT